MNENELKEFFKGKSDIIATSVTFNYFEMVRNWYESLKNVNCEHLVLVVALDEKTKELCDEYKIPCIKSIYDISENDTIEQWRVHEKNVKVYDLLQIAIENNIGIISSEVDIVFLKNPIEKIKQEIQPDYDCCCLSDRRFNDFYAYREQGIDTHIDRKNGVIRKYGKSYDVEYGVHNFAFSYLPPTEKNFTFWNYLVGNFDYFKMRLNDNEDSETFQTVLIKAIKDHSQKTKVLSPFEFVNGTIWDISYLRNKVKDVAYLIHYNTAEGNTPEESKEMKIQKMKENGHWYID